MAIKVYFGETYIDGSYIQSLSKSSRLFDTNFCLGATLCTTYELSVDKAAVSSQPSRVSLRDEDGNSFADLYVDEINEENDNYYSYSLVDGMVKFNQYYDWSALQNPTVQTVLNAMCSNILGTVAPSVDYIGSLTFPYTDGVTCREFISYIAEINGCYAKINNINQLVFTLQNNTPTKVVSINTCADIKIGNHFKFDRVVLNNGIDTVKYPTDGSYTGTGDTLYLNPDNILITDTNEFTMAGIVEHIYGLVNGLEFFNLTTSQCQFDDTIEAGEIVKFDYTGDIPLITQNSQEIITQLQQIIAVTNRLCFIAQYDWTYNTMWNGGFDLNVENKQQEETQIVEDKDRLRRLNIKVDKENGEILQEIASTNGNVSRIIQDASSLTGYFESASGARYVRLSSDGIQVSKDANSGSVNITDDGVYIKNDDNLMVASMKANEFDTTNWVYSETRNGNCLNIFKRST